MSIDRTDNSVYKVFHINEFGFYTAMRKAFEWRKNIELVDFVAEDRDIDPIERVSTVEKLEIKKTYNWMDLNEFERKKKK